VAEEEPCKASIGHCSASRSSEVTMQSNMQGNIYSRADFRDMALNPKTTNNQETKISDNFLPIQRNITQKQQETLKLPAT
jgi:hypothetical protein